MEIFPTYPESKTLQTNSRTAHDEDFDDSLFQPCTKARSCEDKDVVVKYFTYNPSISVYDCPITLVPGRHRGAAAASLLLA